MSHNNIDEGAFVAKQGASYRPTVFDGVYNPGIYSLPVGKTFSWSRGTTVDQPILKVPSGWALLNGPNDVTSPSFRHQWFDRFSIPSGEWLVEMKISMDSATSWNGRVALYSSADVRLSNVVSFRDANRNITLIAKVTGGIDVEVRCVTQTINAVATRLARAVASFTFTAV